MNRNDLAQSLPPDWRSLDVKDLSSRGDPKMSCAKINPAMQDELHRSANVVRFITEAIGYKNPDLDFSEEAVHGFTIVMSNLEDGLRKLIDILSAHEKQTK